MASSRAAPIGSSQVVYSQSKATRRLSMLAPGTSRASSWRGVSPGSHGTVRLENPKRCRAWAKASKVISIFENSLDASPQTRAGERTRNFLRQRPPKSCLVGS